MTAAKTKTKLKTSAEKNPDNFEHAFAGLEQIVTLMESGQMSLEASLAAYQRGNALLQFCQQSLAEVEQQVRILNEHHQLVQFKPQDE